MATKQEIFFNKMEELAKTEVCKGTILEPFVDNIINGTKNRIGDIRLHEILDYVSDCMTELYDKHPNAFKHLPSVVTDNPWESYEGFGEDKYLYAFYAWIEGCAC